MCIDELRFEAAKNRVIGINRERQGIGTLSEKTVHAVLKNYYAPDTDMHEIPIENFVADIFTGTEIIEIQTRSFQVMRRKLDAFLKIYPVTIVYPIPHVKWLSWIDEVTEAIVGEEAVSSVEKYNFTKGFWGANGISMQRGFSTPELKEALVKKRSMENCRECYILADDSKFNQISSVTFAPFESAKVITTGLTKPAYRKCKNVIEV